MHEVFVSPDEKKIPLVDSANLLELAVDAGVAIAHLCGGRARCSTCRVRIVEGHAALAGRTESETAMAEKLDFPDEIRLACQTEVQGSVRLWRLVLDRTDAEMASQLGRGHYVGPVGREVDEAAVMFTDIAGFTAMSESLPAYDIVHILNRFFSRAGEAIEAHGGRVDNYMGDGVLSVFGIDGEADTALSAIKAGLAVLDVASDMHDYVNLIYGHAFKVRVGIGLGEVIFGLMGAESMSRETVIGDVVNVASRLEAANKEAGTKMLVTDDIQARTAATVEYGRRFDLDIRGKAGQIIAHEVLGLTS
ncbi:MAG: adenylate/guanylate cyclase domain-containing protein [Acidimicrobiia bacterium]